MDFDVAIERRVGVLEPQVALAAAEHAQEDLPEVLADLRERGQEQLAGRTVDFANGLMQRLLGRHEVIALTGEELQSALLFLVLLDGQRVDRAQLVERFA